MKDRYLIPAEGVRAEIMVVNSRFIASLAPASSVEDARAFITGIRKEFADATHNVPAFVIGHGNSMVAHCSDDGEPSGTAGRPALAVLQGSGLGDVVVVVTRYFGGTKLGKGGLVRAYGDAVRAVLAVTPRAEKVSTHTVFISMPYSFYERALLLVAAHNGQVLDQDFVTEVSLTVLFREEHYPAFQEALRESSHGRLQAEILESNAETIMPIGQTE